MDKFKTLEEAQAAYDKLATEYKESTNSVTALKNDLEKSEKRANDAEEIARDASSKLVNSAKPDVVAVVIDKKKYKINFGVDGKSKAELAEDKDLLKRLVKIQSGAITLLD